MSVITIPELYHKYREERAVMNISEEQFVSFTVFFPTLLVILSDGVVDMEEWEYMKQLSRFMAKSFKEEGEESIDVDELASAYLKEISYVMKFLADWQKYFLDALKGYISTRSEIKMSVLDTIHLFAEASDGTSSDEQEKIDFLRDYLKL